MKMKTPAQPAAKIAGLSDQLIQGESLGAVLNVSPEAREALRDRALQLYVERRFDDCLVVLRGLAALGDVHPADAMLMSRCLALTGDKELARAAADSASRLLEGMGLIIPEV